jgi:UDP-2-acetamido-2-deoxy-ribo-hexuluronate aminotransferase
MKFIDLEAQQKYIRAKIEDNIFKVMDHGQYIMGPEVTKLENTLSEYIGSKHAIACSSGTDALLISLMALGVRPGDSILTTPFTFFATAEVISLLGAVPVFVDIDETYNMDPNCLASILDHSNIKNPRGIISVNLFGLPADYDKINLMAKKYNLFVVEDAAQSFGATYKGKMSCNLADVSCTSFFPSKPLGCYGDGGMCFTDDLSLANSMRSITMHGKGAHKYNNVRIGINGRLDTIQAAVLLAKFSIFREELLIKEEVAKMYTELLTNIRIPIIPDGYTSAWAQYSVTARNSFERLKMRERLKENDIPTMVYYPTPLHLQAAYTHLNYRKGDFPRSEYMAERIFSLPMHPYLHYDQQKQIIDIIGEMI